VVVIEQNPAAAHELIRRASAYQQAAQPRAEGLHVSDLIYCRAKSWYRLHAEQAGLEEEEHDTDTLVMFLLGHGYHALLEQGVGERSVVLQLPDPGRASIPVHGTVDAVEWDGSQPYPHEFKTTRASAAKPIDATQHYLEQVAAYCLALGTTRGRLSVIYINGAYSRYRAGMRPTIRTYDLTFDDGELAAWKRELARRARLLLADTPPPLPEHRSWECARCPFAASNGGPCPSGPGNERRWFISNLPNFGDLLEDVGL
jgi:CRISPR/Cas system-associated exonuclease Cas4 (RecB family)